MQSLSVKLPLQVEVYLIDPTYGQRVAESREGIKVNIGLLVTEDMIMYCIAVLALNLSSILAFPSFIL